MTRAIDHKLDLIVGDLENAEQLAHDLQVGSRLPKSDIVDFAGSPSVEHPVQRPAMVLHEDPVAFVEAVAVNWKLLAFERISDHERKELLRKLVRPIIVGAASNDSGKAVGPAKAPHQEVRRRLAGRVWAARLERRLLVRLAARPQTPIDFVGRDVEEAPDALPSSRFEQCIGPSHIGFHEGASVSNAAVHMSFGRQVNDRLNILTEQAPHQVGVANVTLNELIVRP